MFYQSLERIKNELAQSKEFEEQLAAKYVSALDEWLISRPVFYKSRLNPLDFSVDEDLDPDIAIFLFGCGLDSKLFSVYYEAETDEQEALGTLSTSQFIELDNNGSIEVEHPFKEYDYRITLENVNILFYLNEKPDVELNFDKLNLKKECTPSTNGSILMENKSFRAKLRSR